jgi:hypothetical protein
MGRFNRSNTDIDAVNSYHTFDCCQKRQIQDV